MNKRLLDLVERVVLTFVGAFVAVYLFALSSTDSAFETLSNKDLLDNAVTAGIAALFPLISGLIGFKVGDKDTASIVSVKKPDPEAEKVPMESPAPLHEEEVHNG